MTRNLRDPSRLTALRESDDPIVAGKGLTRLERGGSAVNVQTSTLALPSGHRPTAEYRRQRKCERNESLTREFAGEPDAGKPHVRFDEGEGKLA